MHDRELHLKPGRLYDDDPRAVLLQLRPRRADRRVRREHGSLRRAAGLHDDRPAPPACRARRDPRDALRAQRPGRGRRLDRPAERRDPRDDRASRRAGSTTQFNLVAQARRQAGSTFKTIVLAAAVAQGMNPSTTLYRSTPVPLPAPTRTRAARRLVGRHDLRQPLPRHDERRERDAALRQHRVRAADARRRPRERRGDGARSSACETPLTTSDGAYVPSIGLGAIAVSPLDMASAYATLAAGGVSRSRWRSARSSSRTARSTPTRAGASRSASG